MIIGLVGPFGSGCTYVAKTILEEEYGYEYISLSDILRDEYQKRNEGNKGAIPRKILQDFGDLLRKENESDYLAKKAAERMGEGIEADSKKFVIDSIRNPAEVEFLKSKYVHFFVLGIFAESNIRWNRVKKTYDEKQAEFLADEKRDKGEKILYGQRVTDAFLTADAIILNKETIFNKNDAYIALKAKVEKYLGLFDGTYKDKTPSEVEAIMAMAYANSLRSSCLKRKVGAAIVDENGNVFSSGYNEVPSLEKPCLSAFGKCYRAVIKADVEEQFDDGQEELCKKVMGKVKLLEKCRALHAEENAILNVARFGSANALKNATLYTTTYPCNLCANKIAQVGIRKVVYYEPYPVEEAKATLEKANIEQEMFEGITFNAYFHVYSEIIP